MAADLHLYVMEPPASEDDLRLVMSNTLGSKYFSPVNVRASMSSERQAARDRIYSCPDIWVGEVSWLKAALFADQDSFVPDAVAAVSTVVGEDLPVIDDMLIKRVADALGQGNTTGYNVTSENPVLAFLEQHRGKRAFTMSL